MTDLHEHPHHHHHHEHERQTRHEHPIIADAGAGAFVQFNLNSVKKRAREVVDAYAPHLGVTNVAELDDNNVRYDIDFEKLAHGIVSHAANMEENVSRHLIGKN